jgi:MFS transporter, ACS family, D-galactonate transporter
MTKESSSAIRYRALTWLMLAAALAYLCRNAVGVAESTIRVDLGLTLEQSGWFMGAFFWSYAVFQVPTGALSQRYGTRWTLSLFAIAWSIATLGIGIANGFWILVVAQLLMGIAQAGIFPAACNSIGHWMPLSQRSTACGMLGAGMQIGAIVASGVTGYLLAPLGWRPVFIAFALPGIVWGVAFAIRFRNRPEHAPGVNASELKLISAGREQTVRVTDASAGHVDVPNESNGSLWALFTQPVIWFLCGQQICRSAGYMFFASWFPTFLQKTRGVSIEESGYLQALVLGGTLAGSVCGGFLVDWVWQRTHSLRASRGGVGAIVLGTCGCLILTSWFVRSDALAIGLIALGAFFASLAGPCAFAATIDIGGKRVPQVFGFMNMSGNFSAALCPVVVGKIFAWTENWNLVLLLFAAIYITGAVCWLFVNPQANHATD